MQTLPLPLHLLNRKIIFAKYNLYPIFLFPAGKRITLRRVLLKGRLKGGMRSFNQGVTN